MKSYKILSVIFIAIFIVSPIAFLSSAGTTNNTPQQPTGPAASRTSLVGDTTSNMLSNGGFETASSGSGPNWAPTGWIHGGQTGCTNAYVSTDYPFEDLYSYGQSLDASYHGYKYIYQQVTNLGPTIYFAVKLVSASDPYGQDCVQVSIRDMSANPNKELFYEFGTGSQQVRGDGWWGPPWPLPGGEDVRAIHEQIQVGNWYYRMENWKDDWFNKFGQPPVDTHTWRINLVIDNFNNQGSMEARFDSIWLSYGTYLNTWSGNEPTYVLNGVTYPDGHTYTAHGPDDSDTKHGDPSHLGNNITIGSSGENNYGQVTLGCQLESYQPTSGEGVTYMQIDIASVLKNNYRGSDPTTRLNYRVGAVQLEVVRVLNPGKSRIAIDLVRNTPGLIPPGGTTSPIVPILETTVKTAIGLAAANPYVSLFLTSTSVIEQLLNVGPFNGPTVDYSGTTNAVQSWMGDLGNPSQETHAFSRVAWGTSDVNDPKWTHSIQIIATATFFIFNGVYFDIYPVSTSITLTYNNDDALAPQFSFTSASTTFQSTSLGAPNHFQNLYWTVYDDNSWYYTITSPTVSGGYSVGSSIPLTPGSNSIVFQIPDWVTHMIGTYTFTCTAYDYSGRSSASIITVHEANPSPLTGIFTSPASGSSYQGSTVTISVTIDLNALPWDPSIPTNIVRVSTDNWATYTTASYSWSLSHGSDNIYTCSLSLRGTNPATTYTISGVAMYSDSLGNVWGNYIPSITVRVYNPPPPPTISCNPSPVYYTYPTNTYYVTWTISGASPGTYTITGAKSQPQTAWSSGVGFQFNVGGLGSPSTNGKIVTKTYTITLRATDAVGQSTSYTLYVYVKCYPYQ